MVGAYGTASGMGGNGQTGERYGGSAYVYRTTDGATYGLVATLVGVKPNLAWYLHAYNTFGSSVAIDGGTVAVCVIIKFRTPHAIDATCLRSCVCAIPNSLVDFRTGRGGGPRGALLEQRHAVGVRVPHGRRHHVRPS